MNQKIKVYLKGNAKESYFLLKDLNDSINKTLFKSINHNIDLLFKNPQLGQPIKKKLFPKKLIKQYNVSNLYRLEISDYWRLIYTIKNDDVYILIFILEIVDHKKYNKLFGYK